MLGLGRGESWREDKVGKLARSELGSIRCTLYNTATEFCVIPSTATLLFCTRALSSPIVDSGSRGKRRPHSCTSSIVGMVMMAAEEERAKKRRLLSSCERVWGRVSEDAMLGLAWVEVKVGQKEKLEAGRRVSSDQSSVPCTAQQPSIARL